MQKHRQRIYQRHGADQVAYEEKVKALYFEADDYDWDDDAQTEAERILNRSRLRQQRGNPRDDDGRQRSRVMTRPVVRTTATTPDLVVHPEVRMRPASAINTRNSNYNKDYSQMSRQAPTPSQWSVQSSAVARKAAANQRRSQPQQQPQPQQYQHQQQYDDTDWRPRSKSESSFGSGLFFGWRRPSYQQYADHDVEAVQQPPPAQYRGKNLHNFSYTDAKIYSPQSHYQQQQQQQQHQHHRQQQGSRARIWWTMDTMGAVNSSHSNQIMLARGAP